MGLWHWVGSRIAAEGGFVPVDQRDPGSDQYFGGPIRRSEIGIDVTIPRARKVPVVKDCLKVRADAVSGLRFGVFERNTAGDSTRREDHPVQRVLADPNPRMTPVEFWAALVDDLDTHGQFIAEIVTTSGGQLSELWRLEPELTILEELPDRSRRVRYSDRFGRSRTLVEGEFWHIPMPPIVDGLRGRSAILDDGREAIAVAIALQQFANILFTNDAAPPFVFAWDKHFKDQESRTNFLSNWYNWVTGKNRHRPAVLEHGMTIEKIGMTNEESQFLETRKELWLDLTRLWRVPPHMVGIMDRATFSNIEHQSLEFVTQTLAPLLELIEASVGKYLIGDPRFRFEFNVASLLRGDIKTRFEAYSRARQWGWLSVNEIRRMEGENGIGPAGDRYIEPLNVVPVGVGDRVTTPRDGTEAAIRFLRQSVANTGGRPRLELVKDAA